MKCGSCGADLYAGMQTCPRCGAFVSTSGAESRSSIIGPVLMVVAIAIALVAAIVAAGFHFIRTRIATNPVYREALAIACSSPELQGVLGQPIQEDWLPLGEV